MTMTDELLDERIRSAVPLADDSNWRDVCRRARRKRIPAALALGGAVAVVVAAPAFALRHQISDLWSSAEPAKNLYVRAFADCGNGAFTLEFDPVRGAVVRQNGAVLARASDSDRAIECGATIHSLKGTPDELRGPEWQPRGPSYDATTLICDTTGPLRISVNPIWDESGTIVGSAISVSEGPSGQPIAGAVLKVPNPTAYPGTSSVYWSGSCRRS
jgi:hypothetical protein